MLFTIGGMITRFWGMVMIVMSTGLALTVPVHAEDEFKIDILPDIPRAMLEAAFDTGQAEDIRAVARSAVQVFPDYEMAITTYAETLIGSLDEAQIVAPGEAASEETQPDPLKSSIWGLGNWEGKFVGSAARATGNAQNTSYGLAFDAQRKIGKFTHAVNGTLDIASAAQPGSDASTLTQRRWALGYQIDYAIHERAYAFGRFSYEEDQFSGFDYRLFGGAGAGYFLFKSEPLTWKVEAGPGYRYSLIDDTDEVMSEFAVYASSDTDWIIRPGLTFEQDLDITWTAATSTFQSLTALSTALNDSFSVGLSYLYRFETDPPLGRERTDTLLRGSLNYGF